MRGTLAALIFGITFLAGSPASAREWADTTGLFKVQAELVAVRGGKVVLEKADGSIISVPLDKLSAADRAYLESLNKPQPTPPTVAIPAPSTAQAAALAQQVHTVLKANCYRCHGEDGASEGGFNFALNLQKIGRTLVTPKNAAASVLYERLTATDDSAMPPIGETPRPSAQEIAAVKAWIEAGTPTVATEKPREFVTNEQIVKTIRADVEKAAERSRRFYRYFTLTHLYNAGVSEDELQTYRNAFTKLVNSLSWNTNLLVPQAVDPARTIFRIDMRDLQWTTAMWEQVEAANPYFLDLQSPDAVAASEATQSPMPYVRADWFVFAASKPPLYHVMLGLPETDLELENLLRVNAAANIDQEQAIRAAFNRSGVSQNNRLIEWHKSPFGSYWKSYDFGGNAGRQNLFENPLGPGTDEGQFQHDGGELIFTLPNGLQGYLLVDAAGKRIDQGPTNIVSDPKRPDKAVTNGVSCMSCHYTGVIPKTDEVGPAVRANLKAFENSKDILALYRQPEELSRILTEDARRFAAAMGKLGVSSLSRSGEPVSAMAIRFEQELDAQLAASEFGLSVEQFFQRLDASTLMSRRFAALRAPGGVIKRDVFVTGFEEATAELGLTGEGLVATTSGAPSLGTRPVPTPRLGGDINKVGEVCRFSDLRWGVKSLAFSPSGVLLAAGKPDRTLLIFDVVKEKQVAAVEKLELLQAIEHCLFTPSGTRFLACGGSGHIAIFEASKAGQLKDSGQFAGHSQEITCLAVSNDGKLALSGSSEKKVRLWEVEKGREIAVFPGFEGKVKACHIARSGRTALATDGATLLELDLTGQPKIKAQRQLTGSWAAGQAAAFSADGSHIAVGDSYDVRLWNLTTGNELPKMETGEIQWSVAFTPDGSRLLSGGNDQVSIWDVRKQRRIHSQPIPNSGYIQCLATSPDNRHAAAAGRSDVHVFRLPAAP